MIGAGFEADVDDRARLPSVFGGRILLDIEFLNGVDGEDGGGVSGNAGAVDDGLTGIGFAVEEAFDEVGVVFGAEAVGAGGGEAAAGITHDAGAKLQEVFVIASAQRQVVDFLVAQGAAESGGGGVDEGDVAADDYDLGNVARLEGEIGANVGGDFDGNVGALG